ncbi:hypothetical protein lerEdw1_003430 [Lerista edwardsae]|nr:hypothetical protein lerEdw1_003430 [Lerista edwardsae]
MAASVMLAERGYLELTGAERGTRRRVRELGFKLPGGGVSATSVRYADSAGGYWYQESAQLGSVTRNRFIHWATSGDTLELVEESLDLNLLNNAVHLKFQNCSLLPGGVHIFETQHHVVILILTNQTAHRLLLPHPARMYRSELITESHMQSVFTDIGKVHFRDPSNYCVIPPVPGLSTNSTASAAWLSSDGGALFALPSASGGIFVLTLPSHDAHGLASTSVVELKQSSVMQRLLTGDQGPSDLPVSLAVHCREHDALLFALYQDHKLRMWSYKDQMCLMVADMLEFVPVNKDLRLAAGTGHKLQLAYSETLGLYIGVYLHAPKQGQETLIDFALTTAEIWALWYDDENQTIVKYINFEHNVAGQWNHVSVQPLPAEGVDIRNDQDPRETFMEAIFMSGQFTNAALHKALQIFSQGTDRHIDLSWDELKKEITIAVENEFQGNVTEYEFSQEEFRQLQIEFWSKFHAYCLQYQEELSRPLALLFNPCSNMVCLLKKGCLSFLAPCSLMDHLYLLPDEQLVNEVESTALEVGYFIIAYRHSKISFDRNAFVAESEFSHDLVSLVQCLRLIGESVSMEMALTMEMACCHLQSPERAAEQILRDLIANDTENLMEDIHSKLQEIKNPISAIGVLIREMDYETDMEMERGFNIAQPLNVRLHLSQLYGSSTTANMVCRCICKISMTRFLICRDLLILQQLLLRLGDAEYIRMLEPCHVNVGSCRFMMGRCYLVMGEGHKALDCFCEAASEVGKEEFLDRLIRSEEVEMASTPRLQYYDKVLRLLDTMRLPELIIRLASLAITEAADDWRSQATLRTCIFKHHLDLGHNNQAYEAMTHNPDSSRQLDCLRQLVVVLCERSQLQDLVEFPYVNLHNEVVGIIEYRARAVDLMTHNYYELLYAFHIYRHNYRKAGTVMFEYGMRLGREVRTLPGLQKQANCYLAAINCLRLIRPEYAWIVQPASGAVYERPGASPKRSHDGECTAAPTGSQVEILELKDLEKECMLARIRLTLAQHDPSTTAITGNSSPKELVVLLVQAGLFDTAISLCQTYNLSLRPVFEGLTFKCIKLQFGGEAALTEAWDWLAANQLPSVITTKETSATDEAWRLLSSYLDRYQSQNSPYHRCVINKLLSHGVPLPNWLINNAAELLRLYLNYDLLDEAVDLVLEYVDAILGKGHDYFGIELYQKVHDKLKIYQQKVETATHNRIYLRN